MPLNLAEWGMEDIDNVLVQDLENGTAMQVKLADDHIDVRQRAVPRSKKSDTTSIEPPWSTAYDLMMGVWIRADSPVWQWLRLKGIKESEVYKRLFKLA